MADTITTRLSLDEVRASVRRIRDQGEKLVDRIRTDAKDLIANAPKVVSIDEARKRLEEARQRAEDAVKVVRDLRARRDEIVTGLVSRVVELIGLAKAEQVASLETRLAQLEERLNTVAKRAERAA
jgi:hypothetical protein